MSFVFAFQVMRSPRPSDMGFKVADQDAKPYRTKDLEAHGIGKGVAEFKIVLMCVSRLS